MTVAYNTTVRNNRQTQIGNAIDGGAGAGILYIYSGVRPASGGAAGTILATLTLPKPSFTVAGGVLTFNAITPVNASSSGTASWARITDSTGAWIADMSVGLSASDINLNALLIAIGAQVAVTAGTITEGNP